MKSAKLYKGCDTMDNKSEYFHYKMKHMIKNK